MLYTCWLSRHYLAIHFPDRNFTSFPLSARYKTSFLAQHIKPYYHLPKACVQLFQYAVAFPATPVYAHYQNLPCTFSLGASSESIWFGLTNLLPFVLLIATHSQSSDANSASSRKPSLATATYDSRFLFCSHRTMNHTIDKILPSNA